MRPGAFTGWHDPASGPSRIREPDPRPAVAKEPLQPRPGHVRGGRRLRPARCRRVYPAQRASAYASPLGGIRFIPPAPAVGSSPESDSILRFRRSHKFHCFSADRRREFIDRQQNSAVPLSSEYFLQLTGNIDRLCGDIAAMPLQKGVTSLFSPRSRPAQASRRRAKEGHRLRCWREPTCDDRHRREEV
jgi:hypothetical protein